MTIKRRRFLTALGGAALALPTLSLMKDRARAQAALPKTLIIVHAHGGTISNQSRMQPGRPRAGFLTGGGVCDENWWKPTGSAGALSAGMLGRIHSGILDDLVEDLTIVRGVSNFAAIDVEDGHSRINMSHMTCGGWVPHRDPSRYRARSISYDQELAHFFDSEAGEMRAPFRSVNLTAVGKPQLDRRAYYGSVQHGRNGEPVTLDYDPAAAWDRYFGAIDSEGVSADGSAILRERSVIDAAIARATRMKEIASTRDRARLDSHLASLEAIRRRLEPPVVAATCAAGSRPPAYDNNDRVSSVAPMTNLVVRAAQCGLSPVIAYQIGQFITDPVFDWDSIRVTEAHALGHMATNLAGRRSQWFAQMLQDQRFRVRQFATIVRALKETPAGDGQSLLDHSLVVYSSEFSNPGSHTSVDLPLMYAGSGGGAFVTGRYVDYNEGGNAEFRSDVGMHNFASTVLGGMGKREYLSGTTFGNGIRRLDGHLPELLV